MIHNVTEGCAEDAVEKSFLVAFVHKIRVRLFFFVPDHRHVKISIDINHRRSLCYGPGCAASRLEASSQFASLLAAIKDSESR